MRTLSLLFLFLFLIPTLTFAQFVGPTVPTSSSITTVSSLTSCSSPSKGGLEFLTTDSLLYLCDGSAWRHIFTENDTQPVDADHIITPYSVVAQAPSGQAAFKLAHTGARIYFDVGGNQYCYSDGSQIICASGIKAGSVSADTYGSYTDSKVPLWFSIQFFPTSSLGTCNGQSAAGQIPEGTVKVLSGASLSAQSRVCACVSDGGGTPAYTWINMGCPNTAGTSTTCPACP